jgi:hypothetical protein
MDLHTSHVSQLYCPTEDRSVSFEEALVELETCSSYERWFLQNPLAHWAEHYPENLHHISSAPGMKLRVPVESPRQMVGLTYLLPFFADLVVFSPALAWPTCDLASSPCCCEFADTHYGLGSLYTSGKVTELFAWLIAARPLMERGLLAYLPICGKTPHCWDCKELLPDYADSAAFTEARSLGSVQSAALAFWVDLAVSARLGCFHLLPWLESCPVAIRGLPSLAKDDLRRRCQFLRIRVPQPRGVSFEQLASLLESAREPLQRFRSALGAACKQAATLAGCADHQDMIRQVESEVVEPASRDLGQAIQATQLVGCKAVALDWTELLVEVTGDETSPSLPLPNLALPLVLAALTEFAERLAESVEVPETSILKALGRCVTTS